MNASDMRLRVHLPLPFFQGQRSTVVDPTDLDTVFEYHLLENLAVGLVRDDPAAPGGYAGVLADRWRQETEQVWSFSIADSQWSDGTPILREQIAEYLLWLRESGSRHVVHLRNLKSVSLRGVHEITLEFSVPTDSGLLHELSLADCALVRLAQHNDWTQRLQTSSGPYAVQSVDMKSKLIVLERNQYSTLSSGHSPKRVEVLWLKDRAEQLKAFTSHDIDIMRRPPFEFRPWVAQLKQTAAGVFAGVPSSIIFLRFDHNNVLQLNQQQRTTIGKIFQDALIGLNLGPSLKPFSQMIPPGFSGYLDKLESREFSDQEVTAHPCEGRIVVDSGLLELDALRSRLEKLSAQAKCRLVLVSDDSQKSDLPIIARTDSFVGNQQDPLGSWSFLIEGTSAPLAPFAGELRELWSRAARGHGSERDLALEAIHRTVLGKSMLTPLLLQSAEYLHSQRVDLSGFNPFDLRLRFYQVRVK